MHEGADPDEAPVPRLPGRSPQTKPGSGTRSLVTLNLFQGLVFVIPERLNQESIFCYVVIPDTELILK